MARRHPAASKAPCSHGASPSSSSSLAQSSGERTVEVTAAVEKIVLETPGVTHTASFPGQSIVLNAISSNYGTMFVILAPFEERRGPTVRGEAIAAQLRARFQREIPEARVLVFGRPAVPGLGNAGGFQLMV